MPTDISFYGIIGVCIVVLILVVYMYIKDLESTKKLKQFEKSIEALNKELYRVQKKAQEKELESNFSGNGLEVRVKKELKEDINNSSKSIYERIEFLMGEFSDFKDSVDNRILDIDSKVKETICMPHSSSTSSDENKIIDMYKSGFSIEQIAKELRIVRGEVEFTLKLSNLL